MTAGGLRLREAMSTPTCTTAAPIFDPLSARIAEMRGWDICKLSGSVAKGAELALPDDVAMANMSDIVDICRRITRAANVALIVDADDGGGSALSVYRTVRELEAAGVAAVEIEDNMVPRYYGEAKSRHALMIPTFEQVGKLKAALAARRHDSTVIVARTFALTELPRDEALARIAAYADTGIDAIMLPGLDRHDLDGRADVEAVHRITDLPIFALGLSWDAQHDEEFLTNNSVRINYVRVFPAYRMAVKAIDDALMHLQAGGKVEELSDRMAPMELIRHAPGSITRADEFEALSHKYITEVIGPVQTA
jgi:carboxyvinyl-carboxyphosphonate phosphorylmutase